MKRWIAGALIGFGGFAFAVMPQVWDQKTEADFAEGEFDGTVVTSRGEIGLAREIDILFSGEKAPPVISAVLEKDGERLTPPVSCGLLPGTYRGDLLERGEIRESVLTKSDIEQAGQIFLVNSVRHWIPAVLV